MYQVIIVDDEALIREGVSKLISWETYEMEVVGLLSGGQAALNFIKNNPVDIVITDIKMPHMDGLTLIRKCQEKYPNVKFIVLSGYTDFDLVKEAVKLGIENYLVKPIDQAEFIQTLLSLAEKLDQESEELRIKEEGAKILRDNIVWRWITGNISNSELKEKKQYLEFPIEKNYQVAVIHLKGNDEDVDTDKEKLIDINEQIKGYISRSRESIGLYTVNFVYLLFPNADKKQEIIREILLKVARIIERNDFDSYEISVGGIHQNPDMIYKSYHQAVLTMDNSVFSSKQHILYYSDTQLDMVVYTRKMLDEVIQLEACTEWNDKSGVNGMVDTIMKTALETHHQKKELIQSFAAIVVTNIIHSILQVNCSLDAEADPLEEKITEVYSLQYYEDIIAWMKDTISLALDMCQTEKNHYSETLVSIIRYLRSNYGKEINLKTVADQFQMNPLYLGRLFKSETGICFTDYINNLRIRKAKQLLLDTNLTTRQIAEAVGYLNTNYFFPIFKRQVGLSPTEFRKQIKEESQPAEDGAGSM